VSNWRAFPKGSWVPVGRIVSGFGKGEGSYNTAYAIDTGSPPFLNGRISAQIRLARNRPVNAAGLVCRADELRSFAAFYVMSDDGGSDSYSVRLAAFKHGRLDSLGALKDSVHIRNGEFSISLQFFAGDILGEVISDGTAHLLKHLLPIPPFPGSCGVVRFYDTAVTASGIQIEEIAMKPILPREESVPGQNFPFHVFLSHASTDKPEVLRLIEILKNAGITYWVDHERINFGDGIVAKIEDGLKRSRYVVVCLSDSLAASGWCRAEYGPILYREFSGDTSRRVIPLSLDGSKNAESIPLLLSDKMRADLTSPSSVAAFIEFLNRPT
jgi:hypothetical protein